MKNQSYSTKHQSSDGFVIGSTNAIIITSIELQVFDECADATLSRANWTHKSWWDIEDNTMKDQQIKSSAFAMQRFSLKSWTSCTLMSKWLDFLVSLVEFDLLNLLMEINQTI